MKTRKCIWFLMGLVFLYTSCVYATDYFWVRTAKANKEIQSFGKVPIKENPAKENVVPIVVRGFLSKLLTTSPSLTSISLVDPYDPTRSSSSTLQVAAPFSTRGLQGIASFSGGSGTPAWYVNNSSVGSGNPRNFSLARPFFGGITTYNIKCSYLSTSKTGVVEVYNALPTEYEIGNNETIKKLANLLTSVNKLLGQNEDAIEWTSYGKLKTYYVDKARTPLVALSKELSLNGGAKIAYTVPLPFYCFDCPYFIAGAVAKADAAITWALSLLQDGRPYPGPAYTPSGSLTGTGRIGIGAELRTKKAGILKVIVSGTVYIGASATGTIENPATVALTTNIGKATLDVVAKVSARTRPLFYVQWSKTFWEGYDHMTRYTGLLDDIV